MFAILAWGSAIGCAAGAAAGGDVLEVGLAVRDITPPVPIWLAGYAARTQPATNVDTPLLVQALALKNATGERFVFVALDNCEVSGEFIGPTLRRLEQRHALARGAVMVVCSHTHSGPVLEGGLLGMYPLEEADRAAVVAYGRTLKAALGEAVEAALGSTRPAMMEHGVGHAAFAVNRRVQAAKTWRFGENPKGPVDREVPVLKILDTNGTVRAVLFGYACHATSIQGADFYTVSGDYIAYARQHLEAVYPGARAVFLTGMGADANPAPRGSLLQAKRHGLELAGAVVSVLQRPMRPVRGPFQFAYAEPELPFQPAPAREQILLESRSDNRYVRSRALRYQRGFERGDPVPSSLRLPVAAVRLGGDLTFLAMGGEVVVDYALEFKRAAGGAPVWTVGYAYEIPCYIPSRRILQEGGYEAESSLMYYGWYGPFRPEVETIVVGQVRTLADAAGGLK
ncbi:MAG: neutral/alkaline non-lysosomal ceramidase N-terminal domain-containing protein [Verrucomicrobia bacterium]|nr:neutral/alkaline non-lysosomal ceramidase N-terminal domain-containing protein [Verrucomicrobiota bacterium]